MQLEGNVHIVVEQLAAPVGIVNRVEPLEEKTIGPAHPLNV